LDSRRSIEMVGACNSIGFTLHYRKNGKPACVVKLALQRLLTI